MAYDELTFLMGEYLDALAIAQDARRKWRNSGDGAVAGDPRDYAYARMTAREAAEKLAALVAALPAPTS